MPIEIERKFLVKDQSFKAKAKKSYEIIQGFLNRDPERTVRVRLLDQSGILTVKGTSSEDGLSRFEWETNLSYQEAKELLRLCEQGVISKMRYIIPEGDYNYEVDEFFDENAGLIVAEIELPSEESVFNKPEWLGPEVTGDLRYYNSYLSKTPFKSWT